jgi:hypothetical protein
VWFYFVFGGLVVPPCGPPAGPPPTEAATVRRASLLQDLFPLSITLNNNGCLRHDLSGAILEGYAVPRKFRKLRPRS